MPPSPVPQITPHLVVMWRPDIGKYTGHLQELSTDPNAHVIKDASCNVIPQVPDVLAGMGGPLLRAWQSDPWNRNSMYYQMGFDSQICNLAMTNAVGAAWMTKPGPLGRAGYTAIPLFEGVAPTNHAASTECGDDCAFVSKKLMATALVSSSNSRCSGHYVLFWRPTLQQAVLPTACLHDNTPLNALYVCRGIHAHHPCAAPYHQLPRAACAHQQPARAPLTALTEPRALPPPVNANHPQDVMFAFERNKLKDWVADIKELIQKDLRGRPGWGAHTR